IIKLTTVSKGDLPMLRLYFGDIYSIAATVLILGLLAFTLFSWRDRDGVTRWDRRLTIFLSGLLAIFLKRGNSRKSIFFIAAALFTAQVVVIETARLSAWMGGTL